MPPVDAVVAAHVVAIDVHDLDRAQAHAGALDDEALHRRVVEVDVLHRRALLHLAEPPRPGTETFQHVHAHAHAGVHEGRLEDGADVAVRHELARAGRRLAVLPGLLVDQHAAGEEVARVAADLGALVEDGGEALRRGCAEVGLVAGEPQAARALEAGDVLRLAEGGLHVSAPLRVSRHVAKLLARAIDAAPDRSGPGDLLSPSRRCHPATTVIARVNHRAAFGP